VEVVQDLRDRHKILFITAQPDATRAAMGLSREDEAGWFRSTLGIPPESDRLRTVSAADDELPEEVLEKGVIVGGSAHSVYEDAPWMKNLRRFLRRVHRDRIPLFGVCFGFQIIAETFGGKVEKGHKLEAGLVNISLTPEGQGDPLFHQVPPEFDIYAYHHDGVVEAPDFPGTAVLARSGVYPFQALAIGESTRAVQFHPEIGRERIEQALSQRRQSLIDGKKMTQREFQRLMEDLETKEFDEVRRQILRNFDRNFVLRFAEENV